MNGLVGRVMEFKSTDTALKVVYVKLNYEKPDKMTMQCDTVACQNCWVSIEKVKNSFSQTNKIRQTINPIQDGLFRGCSQMGGPFCPPSLKSITHMLQ